MTSHTHDTLVDLNRGTPVFFVGSAWALPVGVATQFLLAGQSLFNGLGWSAHAILGSLLAVPVLILFASAIAVRHLRGFGWWAAVLLATYVVQIILATSGPFALSFHPFNAALMLTASLVLLAKVERRRRRIA